MAQLCLITSWTNSTKVDGGRFYLFDGVRQQHFWRWETVETKQCQKQVIWPTNHGLLAEHRVFKEPGHRFFRGYMAQGLDKKGNRNETKCCTCRLLYSCALYCCNLIDMVYIHPHQCGVDADRSAFLASGFPAGFPRGNAGAGGWWISQAAPDTSVWVKYFVHGTVWSSFPSMWVRVCCLGGVWFRGTRPAEQREVQCLTAVPRLWLSVHTCQSCFGLLWSFGYLLGLFIS